jgi:hypothetical protein
MHRFRLGENFGNGENVKEKEEENKINGRLRVK